jgi:hypothetical protein
MFADYITLVLQDYEQKRENNTVPKALLHLKPAGIRDLCLSLYMKENYDPKKDGITLNYFFGQHDDNAGMARAIKNFELAKFKPLINYLKKGTEETNEKNIELLAWLLGFEPRPFEFGKKYEVGVKTKFSNTEVVITDVDPGTTGKPEEATLNNDITKPQIFTTAQPTPLKKGISNTNIAIGILVITIILSGIIYIYNNGNNKNNVMGSTLKGPEACMYWTGDHYEQVSCNEKINNTLIIALDSFKLLHFKKITQPDTITQKHVGNIWYIKTEGDIEFYTAEGAYPADMKKRLKPATAYIIDKYILSKSN